MPIEDERLIELVRQRDHKAFEWLVERHLSRSVSLAQGVLGGAAVADEVVQEVFVKIWERPELFDAAKARFTTWLHRVVVNACIDRRRDRRHEPLEAVLEQPADLPAALDEVHLDQRSRAVQAGLATLPARQRMALALFYMQGMSQKEAATVMEVSDSAFESLLQRGRSALATALSHLRGEHT